MRPILSLSLILVLVACVAEGPGKLAPIDPMPPENACGADGLQGLVGQDAKVLAGMAFVGPVRVIKPGMAVTMDYAPQRLNVDLDANGIIKRVTCG